MFYQIIKLYSINWPNFIVWLNLFLETLSNICIVFLCFPRCNVKNFETDLIFLMKPFSTQPKSQDKKLNILRTKRTFKVRKKNFFVTFKGLSVAKNCLRPESAPLIITLENNKFIPSFCDVKNLNRVFQQ